MTVTREWLGFLPGRMQSLPVDKRGYPVPKFVEWIDGEPDFRVMNREHFRRCIKFDVCWICGERLGAIKVFPIGPMCCINRISAEPPCHYDCARFAAQNCPFLARPMATRRKRNLPDHVKAAGIMIERNPGVTALWKCRGYTTIRANGILFELGTPVEVEFWHHGRQATREEIDHSVNTGLPLLEEHARADGYHAMKELERMKGQFRHLLDQVVPA